MPSIFHTNAAKAIGLLAGACLLAVCMLASVRFGLTATGWKTVVEAYTAFNGSNEHLIIRTARMPRALIAAAVGASLALAGALMQALTRNPLASPSVFGLNHGASFLIVAAVSLFSVSSLHSFMWIAFAGAGAAAFAIYALGSLGRAGLTPMKLTLAGAAMAALFSSFTQGLLILNEKALEEVLFWLSGSVEGRKLELLLPVLPFLAFAWIGSMAVSQQINVLMLGEDVAKGLGQRTAAVKLFSWLLVVLLAGGSVAVAGPIVFVGVVVPHIARFLAGRDYRWLIPYCIVLGAVLLLLADIAARFVIMPKEVPVGVMTAIIGAPFFIYIARRGIAGS